MTNSAPEAAPIAPPALAVLPPKKDQEDANIEVYERVFSKCLGAAARIVEKDRGSRNADRELQIAAAIFDRFYSDQVAQRSAKLQADAMIQGMTSVLEGRR